jgi:hypothetical protein
MIRSEGGTSYAGLNELVLRSAGRPGADLAITDEQALALYRRWNTALAARLDYALEFQGMRPGRDAAADAWLHLEHDEPTLRALLDQCADRVGVRPSVEYEAYIMAAAAGLIDMDDTFQRGARSGLTYLAEVRARGAVVPAKIA